MAFTQMKITNQEGGIMSPKEKLAEILLNHPNAVIMIDNDCWDIFDGEPEEDEETFELKNKIADDTDFYYETDWYSGSNIYGAGVAEALLFALNKVAGLNIKASAV